MKKILFALVAVLTISASAYVYTQKQNAITLNDLAMENVEALAVNEHGAGGMANKYCPIWNVTYSGTWPVPTISCSTGGVYKCENGSCPHGS